MTADPDPPIPIWPVVFIALVVLGLVAAGILEEYRAEQAARPPIIGAAP